MIIMSFPRRNIFEQLSLLFNINYACLFILRIERINVQKKCMFIWNSLSIRTMCFMYFQEFCCQIGAVNSQIISNSPCTSGNNRKTLCDSPRFSAVPREVLPLLTEHHLQRDIQISWRWNCLSTKFPSTSSRWWSQGDKNQYDFTCTETLC